MGRNRRFGHLVHVLVRSHGGAKLPSVGLCLNASKAESRLVTATIPLDICFCLGNDSQFTDSIPLRSLGLCCKCACHFLYTHLVEQLPHCDLLRLSPLTG